jgi:hypothetical protein
MAKDEKKTIIVDDVKHNIDDLTQQQVAMVNHLQDLERKISNARFNVDQLTVGKEAFVKMLASSLKDDGETEVVAAE